MKDLEELKDKIAPLRRGKWVAGAVQMTMPVRAMEDMVTEARRAVEERGNIAVDEAVAACFLAMSGATPAEPAATEALKYIDGWIDNKLAMDRPPAMNLDPAAKWALDEMRVHIRASLERLAKGGSLHATTPVSDLER